jgi:maltose alpha-D-glucosyltransferase/alpha-amylase
MVTEDERAYMNLAYARDPRARVNVGIRRRLAPLVENGRRRIELLHGLLFSLPGTPVVYYGDELGMGDDVGRPDRDGVRTPMQWKGEPGAGFSPRPPEALYARPVSDPVYGVQAVNVEAQEKDPSSLLHWMRNMIRLRRQFKVFGRGGIDFLPVANPAILAYVRRWESDVVLCVANLSRHAQPAELDLSEFEGQTPVEMLGYTPFPRAGRLPYLLTLGGYGFYWFELRQDG